MAATLGSRRTIGGRGHTEDRAAVSMGAHIDRVRERLRGLGTMCKPSPRPAPSRRPARSNASKMPARRSWCDTGPIIVHLDRDAPPPASAPDNHTAAPDLRIHGVPHEVAQDRLQHRRLAADLQRRGANLQPHPDSVGVGLPFSRDRSQERGHRDGPSRGGTSPVCDERARSSSSRPSRTRASWRGRAERLPGARRVRDRAFNGHERYLKRLLQIVAGDREEPSHGAAGGFGAHHGIVGRSSAWDRHRLVPFRSSCSPHPGCRIHGRTMQRGRSRRNHTEV